MVKCDYNDCQETPLSGEARCFRHRYVGRPGTGYAGGGGPTDPPIVISGGSVTIEFDESLFPQAGQGRRSNPNKKIRRVEISVYGAVPQIIDVPDGNVTVKIFHGDP
jgi:hypothetical protein